MSNALLGREEDSQVDSDRGKSQGKSGSTVATPHARPAASGTKQLVMRLASDFPATLSEASVATLRRRGVSPIVENMNQSLR